MQAQMEVTHYRLVQSYDNWYVFEDEEGVLSIFPNEYILTYVGYLVNGKWFRNIRGTITRCSEPGILLPATWDELPTKAQLVMTLHLLDEAEERSKVPQRSYT